MRRRALIPSAACLFILAAFTTAQAAQPQTFSLTAQAGQFKALVMGEPAAFGQFRASLRMTDFAPAPAWPPAAYVGVQQGKDRQDSVQVLAVRNHPEDQYLVVGYRFVRQGKEVELKSIKNVPLGATIEVAISFLGGQVTIEVDSRPPVTIKTPFARMAPYASVSSGEAAFTFVP